MDHRQDTSSEAALRAMTLDALDQFRLVIGAILEDCADQDPEQLTVLIRFDAAVATVREGIAAVDSENLPKANEKVCIMIADFLSSVAKRMQSKDSPPLQPRIPDAHLLSDSALTSHRPPTLH